MTVMADDERQKIDRLVSGTVDYAKAEGAFSTGTSGDWPPETSEEFRRGAHWMIRYLIFGAERRGVDTELIAILAAVADSE